MAQVFWDLDNLWPGPDASLAACVRALCATVAPKGTPRLRIYGNQVTMRRLSVARADGQELSKEMFGEPVDLRLAEKSGPVRVATKFLKRARRWAWERRMLLEVLGRLPCWVVF